jgi:hypothetical protein
MNTDHHRESAKIYKFPLGGRASARNLGGSQDIERFKNYVDCSNSYHQEAIEEARKADTDGPKTHS